MNDFVDSISILTLIVAFPVAGAILTALVKNASRQVAIATAAITFVLSGLLLIGFDRPQGDFQFIDEVDWIPAFGVSFKLGVDGISLFLVVMSSLVFLLASLWPRQQTNTASYFAWILMLEAGCLGAFLALDLFLFFVFFEVVLVPMYFLVAGWGAAERGRAAIKFFIYTLAGSAFLFVGMLALVLLVADNTNSPLTFDITQLTEQGAVTATEARWLFVAFAIAFAVKIPIFPLHTWLPITYEQSPVAGVVLSSAVMVKLGTYGLVRFCLYLFPEAAHEFAPWLLTLAVIGMVYGAAIAAVQRNLRRLLAYSSLSHLGFVVLGTFAFSDEGLTGAVLQMVNHGIIAAALFLLLGMVYVRFGSVEIAELRGIQKRAPILAALFTVAVMASIGVPGLNGFVGEFLILIGTFVTYRWWAVVGTAAVVLAAIYLLWAYQRAFHLEPDESSANVTDLSKGERAVVAPLIALMLFLGVYPQPVLDRIEPSVQHILQRTPGYVAGEDRVPEPASGMHAGSDDSVPVSDTKAAEH